MLAPACSYAYLGLHFVRVEILSRGCRCIAIVWILALTGPWVWLLHILKATQNLTSRFNKILVIRCAEAYLALVTSASYTDVLSPEQIMWSCPIFLVADDRYTVRPEDQWPPQGSFWLCGGNAEYLLPSV